MVDIVKTGFYEFVLTLSDHVAKKVIWDQYFAVKAESGRIPAMKRGAAEFSAICLLKEYSCVMGYENAVRQCGYIFYQFFQYTPSEIMNTVIKNVIENLNCGLTYGEYERTVNYIKKMYGKWLSEMEFSNGRAGFDYEAAYENFKNTAAPALKGWEDVQKSGDEAGIVIHVCKPDLSINPQIEKFFEDQKQEAEEKYGNYENFDKKSLYEAYQKLEVIPCKTVYVYHLAVSMEEKLTEIKRHEWEQKLEMFKAATLDRQVVSGRVIYGDNECRVKQAEDAFVNSGKFEYIMLLNDTSKRLDGREGLAITTENLYYKGKFSSGEIKLSDISHFEFSGKMFSQGLTVRTVSGKKYSVPCNVGKTEHYTYLRVLEELIRILKTEETEEKQDFLQDFSSEG